MAFVGDFTVSQNADDTITITDTSTGSDPTITGRTVTLTDYQNQTFYTTTWDISDSSITLNGVLDKDHDFNITVAWLAPSPDPAGTYSVTKLMEFNFFNMIFLGQLIAEIFARNPNIVNDTRFMNNFFAQYAFIVSANIATGLMNDIFKAQVSLDMATFRKDKQSIYF